MVLLSFRALVRDGFYNSSDSLDDVQWEKAEEEKEREKHVKLPWSWTHTHSILGPLCAVMNDKDTSAVSVFSCVSLPF